MQDKVGFRSIYRVVLMLEFCVCAFIPFIVQTNKYLYLILVFIGYLCLGAHFVIFPNVMVQIFGSKSSVQLCSFIYITRCPSALLSIFIPKALANNFGELSYSIMFYTSCVFVFMSAVVLTTLFDETPIRKAVASEKEICLPNISSTASTTSLSWRIAKKIKNIYSFNISFF